MSDVIYGRNAVFEAIRSGKPVDRVFIATALSGPKISQIISAAERKKIPVESISRERLVELAGNRHSQGMLAIIRSYTYATLNEIIENGRQLNEPLLLGLLDGIEDPHNLGAIIRSADAAGLHGIVIPKRRAVGLTPTVTKTSAGASNYFLTAQVANLNHTIDDLKRQNVWIVGADQSATQNYTEADLKGALGIIIGSEGKGLHRLVKEKCDFLVRIPMCGKINSLNASVAAALIFFEARRQRDLR